MDQLGGRTKGEEHKVQIISISKTRFLLTVLFAIY